MKQNIQKKRKEKKEKKRKKRKEREEKQGEINLKLIKNYKCWSDWVANGVHLELCIFDQKD